MVIADLEKSTCILPQGKRAASRKVAVFRLADQAYGLPLDVVQEILPMMWLSRPPGIPKALAGFFDRGGVSIPVVRLAALFGLPEQPAKLYTPLIVLRCADKPLALSVDEIQEIVSIQESQIAPLQESFCFNDSAIGLAACGQTTLVLLSHEGLLTKEEKSRIEQLAEIEQARLDRLREDCA